MKNAPQSNDSKTQIDRFKEAARELGCDEDEAAFDEKLKGLVTPKPKGKKADD